MKTSPRYDGQRRIFNKALQSALCSPSLSQKDSMPYKRTEAKTMLVAKSNTHVPKSTEVKTASFESPIQKDTNEIECSFSPNISAIPYITTTNSQYYTQMEVNNYDYSLLTNYFTETTPATDFWMKESHLDSVKENLHMASSSANETDPWTLKNSLMAFQQLELVSNDTDAWIMKNRMMALQQLEMASDDMDTWIMNNRNHLESDSSGQYSSTSISPPCKTYSTEMASDDMDAWIMNNRQMALQHLESDSSGQYSSTSISPPYKTYSTDEISPISVYNSSGSEAFTISPLSSGSSLSPECCSLKEHVSETNEKCTFEKHNRPIVCKQEGITLELTQQRNFSKNPKENSLFLNEIKSTSQIDKVELVCKNTNHPMYEELYPEKETSQKDFHITDLNLASNDVDCCNTFHDKPVLKNEDYIAKLPGYNVASLMTFKSTTGFFDSHCHIDFLFNREKFKGTYANYIAINRDRFPESYNGCIAVFCKPFTFAKEKIWRKHLEQDKVWGAFGCHPKSAKFYDVRIEKDLENALDHPKVKALGEIGLDYSKGNKCSKLEQHHVFRRQLRIARKRQLRVVIHCRDADDDTIKIMHEILPKDTIFHLHCFTGSWERAQKWIEEFPNVFIGITNLVTFPSATETHEVARQLPLDRLLLETDAPYFVPSVAPKDTNSSHPGMAIHVAAQIAALKNIPLENVLNWTSANTKIVYNIT